MKRALKNFFSGNLFPAVVMLAGLMFLQSCGLNFGIQKNLERVAVEISKKLPMDIGGGTKWTKVEALPNKIFRYSYILEGIAVVDTAELKKEQESNILKTIINEPSLKYFRDNDVIMQYYYEDKNGKLLYSIAITPDMYKGKK